MDRDKHTFAIRAEKDGEKIYCSGGGTTTTESVRTIREAIKKMYLNGREETWRKTFDSTRRYGGDTCVEQGFYGGLIATCRNESIATYVSVLQPSVISSLLDTVEEHEARMLRAEALVAEYERQAAGNPEDAPSYRMRKIDERDAAMLSTLSAVIQDMRQKAGSVEWESDGVQKSVNWPGDTSPLPSSVEEAVGELVKTATQERARMKDMQAELFRLQRMEMAMNGLKMAMGCGTGKEGT